MLLFKMASPEYMVSGIQSRFWNRTPMDNGACLEKLDREMFSCLSYSHYNMRTKVHPMKMISRRFRMTTGNAFLTQYIIHLWNYLPQDMLVASSFKVFQRKLDNFIEDKSDCQWLLVVMLPWQGRERERERCLLSSPACGLPIGI